MPARPVSARWAGIRAPTGRTGSWGRRCSTTSATPWWANWARVPTAVTRSPGRTGTSRLGHTRGGAVPAAMTSGASSPYSSRTVAAASTTRSATRNSPACDRQLVGAPAEADLDDGGGRQRGDVQHAALAHHLGQRVPDLGVGHADDQPHLRAEPAHEQGGLQCGEVVGGEADDGRGLRQPGLGQRLAQPAAHQRHVPLRRAAVRRRRPPRRRRRPPPRRRPPRAVARSCAARCRPHRTPRRGRASARLPPAGG